MGKQITHCGENVGDGQKVKLVNQIAVALSTEAACEGVLFAIRTGANVEAALEAVGAGAGGSWAWNNLGARMASGDYAPGFKIEHLTKDLRLALEAAEAVNLSLPGTQFVLSQLARLQQTHSEAGLWGNTSFNRSPEIVMQLCR